MRSIVTEASTGGSEEPPPEARIEEVTAAGTVRIFFTKSMVIDEAGRERIMNSQGTKTGRILGNDNEIEPTDLVQIFAVLQEEKDSEESKDDANKLLASWSISQFNQIASTYSLNLEILYLFHKTIHQTYS